MQIRIVDTPIGEAPEHVRRAWVGLEFTVVKGPKKVWVTGSLTGPKTLGGFLLRVLKGQRFPRVTGYLVKAPEALGMLRAKQPEAAAWLEQNCPQIFSYGGRLFFDAKACQEF